MPQRVLNENWSDYDDRKKRHADARFFSCEEAWERDYLIKKIRKVYPQYGEALIQAAISACCLEVRAPRPRKTFVECVIRRLSS
ncbi:MAG: hypothetical protein JWQ09_236 [Segetibacter sp.]|nr:hypothetical protein [Segetibacter sp.]